MDKLKPDILIQLTKAERLLTKERYNNKCLDPMRKLIKELRKDMDVMRVKTDGEEKIIYNTRTTPLKFFNRYG